MLKQVSHQVGLAALLIACSGAFGAAQAAPDPLFDAVLDDIRQELPEGWQFRLPTAVPSESELYPFISQATDTELIVSLGVTPDCAEASCSIGMIGVTNARSAPENWPPEGQNVTPVELSEGIQGYHFLQGEADTMNQLVMWQQDGLTYAIVTLANDPPQEEFVAIARSMANEPPISR
ncbi:MAG: hypothetical protein ACFCVD_15090 [Nodosilinea sp.]